MRVDDGRFGVGRRDHLEQVQIARRIEEVRAQQVPAESFRPPLGERRDRNARRVRADDRVRAPMRVDPLEQRTLDVELLDDRFDDPVTLVDSGQIVVEAAGPDQRVRRRREERIRLQRPRALQPLARRVAGDVEQERSHARVRQVRRDLRAHGAGADDSSGLDSEWHCAGFRVRGSGFGVQVLGSWVPGSGFGFRRSGFRVPRLDHISAQRVLCAEACLRREHTKILWHGNLPSRCGIRSLELLPFRACGHTAASAIRFDAPVLRHRQTLPRASDDTSRATSHVTCASRSGR